VTKEYDNLGCEAVQQKYIELSKNRNAPTSGSEKKLAKAGLTAQRIERFIITAATASIPKQ
jgi:hypothetical protein